MPAWSVKDERQYKHILKSCRTGRKRRALSTCKRIAAATVNKQRRRGGRTLSGVPSLSLAESNARIRKLLQAGCKVSVVDRPEGRVVLKRCPRGSRV
jgi:hypothetical protein